MPDITVENGVPSGPLEVMLGRLDERVKNLMGKVSELSVKLDGISDRIEETEAASSAAVNCVAACRAGQTDEHKRLWWAILAVAFLVALVAIGGENTTKLIMALKKVL